MSDKEQVYKSLKLAAEKIGENNYRVQIKEYLKHHKSTKKFRYSPTPEHIEIIDAIGKLLDDKISPEEAMSLLHQYDTMKQRFPEKNPRVVIPVTKRTGKIGYFGVYDTKTDELLSSFFHKPVTDRVGIKAEAQRIADHFKTRVKVRRL